MVVLASSKNDSIISLELCFHKRKTLFYYLDNWVLGYGKWLNHGLPSKKENYSLCFLVFLGLYQDFFIKFVLPPETGDSCPMKSNFSHYYGYSLILACIIYFLCLLIPLVSNFNDVRLNNIIRKQCW